MAYEHTQRAPLHFAVLIPGTGILVTAFLADGPPWLPSVLGPAGLLMVALAFSFQYLRVRGGRDGLQVRFGPLPLFRREIPFAEMRSAQVERSGLIDGWGIHYTVGRGWIWNLWGYDCVAVELDKGRLRIGTDDPQGLERFLQERIAETQA